VSVNRAHGVPTGTLIADGLTRCQRETPFHTMRVMAFGALLDLGILEIDRLRAECAELLDAGLAVQQILSFFRQLEQSG
jgi:hypothetical protein